MGGLYVFCGCLCHLLTQRLLFTTNTHSAVSDSIEKKDQNNLCAYYVQSKQDLNTAI